MNAQEVLESQNNLRLENTGCDVTFKIGTIQLPAHRVILMARMEYFRNKKYTSDSIKRETFQFDPQIINPTVFQDFLTYIYTLRIEITDDVLEAMYKIADFFSFDELKRRIKDYIRNNLSFDNLGFFTKIAKTLGLKDLVEMCEQFMKDNLACEINRRYIIPYLTLEQLEEFLKTLKAAGRFEEMFTYSILWIEHDPNDRLQYLQRLYTPIPLEQLSVRFLKETLVENSIVRNDNLCSQSLIDAIANRLKYEVLYLIGGLDGTELSSVSRYDNSTRKWISTTPMPTPRARFGTAVIDRMLYVCGGCDGQPNMKELTAFDTHAQSWAQLAPMNHARRNCASAVLNGLIYVAGGNCNDHILAVVERYKPKVNQWEAVPSMPTKRWGLELVSLDDFLYAIGGHDGENGLKIVERYDPKTDQWSKMANMNHFYQTFGSAVLNGYIYVVGENACEAYYPPDNKWTVMASPSKGLSGRRLVVYDGKLTVVGGQVGEKQNWKGGKTVEVFDFQAQVWRKETDMDVGRCYHGVAVVKG